MFHLQPQNLPVEREEGGGRNCTLGLIFHFTYIVKFHSIEYLKIHKITCFYQNIKLKNILF